MLSPSRAGNSSRVAFVALKDWGIWWR